MGPSQFVGNANPGYEKLRFLLSNKKNLFYHLVYGFRNFHFLRTDVSQLFLLVFFKALDLTLLLLKYVGKILFSCCNFVTS